jgi:hypothetical protein
MGKTEQQMQVSQSRRQRGHNEVGLFPDDVNVLDRLGLAILTSVNTLMSLLPVL